jgi:cytochrome c peroxidase
MNKLALFLVPLALAFSGAALAAAEDEPIQPIKAPAKINQAKADLGAKLFFDPRLSKSGFISCNSCHNLSMGGSDNLPTSIGHGWQEGPINSPTVLNADLNFVQFWDGRAADLKAQAGGPIENPIEMGSTHEHVVTVLQTIPGYVKEFKAVFSKNKIDIDQVTDAIAEFEKTLVTPNSRFDKWLKGDKKALTKQELAGYQLFKDNGCTACHYGENVGGTSFQKFGVFANYHTKNASKGRVGVTGDAEDEMVFKVPTLRNVELTYPYFHDGAVETLEEAVDTMESLQLGGKFTKEENAAMVAFLKTLTGEQPQFKLPLLPPSVNKTPAPQPFAKK